MKNASWFDRALAAIPGGVNSPVRAFGSVGGVPRFIERSQGALVWDCEGRDYVDLVASWGPLILGHAHPVVLSLASARLADGLSFGAPTPVEVELAELVCERVEAVKKLRLLSTGTEAAMTAVRLARAHTGRRLIIKFAGHYHGHADPFLAEAGSGMATFSLPASAGVSERVAAETLVLPYNDLEAVERVFLERGSDVAGVIVEAVPANMGVVVPQDDFNQRLCQLTRRNGAVFIFDEVLTGFRVGPAGVWGVESRFTPYTPDLFCFAKVLGGGLPVAGVGGREEIMELLAPSGPVYQAGTLSGNPVAVSAGLATLTLADSKVYAQLDWAAELVRREVSAALSRAGVEHVVSSFGNLFSLAFRDSLPTNYAEALAQDSFRYPPFFHALLAEGVMLPPSPFEAWFVNAALEEEHLERIFSALPKAARAAASAKRAD